MSNRKFQVVLLMLGAWILFYWYRLGLFQDDGQGIVLIQLFQEGTLVSVSLDAIWSALWPAVGVAALMKFKVIPNLDQLAEKLDKALEKKEEDPEGDEKKNQARS